MRTPVMRCKLMCQPLRCVALSPHSYLVHMKACILQTCACVLQRQKATRIQKRYQTMSPTHRWTEWEKARVTN